VKGIPSMALICGMILLASQANARSLKEIIHFGAQETTNAPVVAELSRTLLNPGETAELRLRISGSTAATVPQNISASGLEIRFAGKSAESKTSFFRESQSLVCTYTVTPLRRGNFT